MNNYRIFVEKKAGFQTEANSLYHDLVNNLGVDIKGLRLINIYDVFNIEESLLLKAKKTVFSEIATDYVYDEIDLTGLTYLATEFLDGQFDQRAFSAMQCLSLIGNNNATVRSGKLIIFEGNVTDSVYNKIKKYYINEIESKVKNLDILELPKKIEQEPVKEVENFNTFNEVELEKYRNEMSLAMSYQDIQHVQAYFRSEKRNPTETEIRMLDTYWSDHCRHTTFETMLENITFSKDTFGTVLENTFNEYLAMRKKVKRDKKPITLMDMACINARYEKNIGNLTDLEESDEINACSVYIDCDVDGKIEKYLLMFKNETHNHPTEIEPFGGASTCIGGAIRDPLSGRSYVYQAMRVTGAADITKPVSETMEGKLPQRVISKTAAHGYSSYGNQIGLATTYVKEIYHPGYVAKRMEVGAVVGAAPASYVKRLEPQNGDVVILLGGRTGRDGIGGATGSSKEHSEKSLEICASEVQKGNAPEERKIQHLFRNKEVTSLIKRSNDFGAGGVSVAIGELADGLEINLDLVPTKYEGLNGTEIAISESQERMAVVIDKDDVFKFIALAQKENIETTVVAKVTDTNRLVMYYKGQKIVDISRDFINTNGVRQSVNVEIEEKKRDNLFKKEVCGETLKDKVLNNLSELNVSMNKGLVEMFDATIGATTVLMPYGGKYQLTETQASVQKIPLLKGNTKTCSVMSYGYDPYLTSQSPYHGAMYAVVDSIAKIVAAGAPYNKIHFSFQEFFERLNKDPKKWGNVVEALLGSIRIQKEFGLASIGGKDSMSGTFKDIHVPPTLISFAISVGNTDNIISPELKNVGNKLYLIKHNPNGDFTPNTKELIKNYTYIHNNILDKKILSAYAIGFGGVAEALFKMSYGNKLGFNVNYDEIFDLSYGSILVESNCDLDNANAVLLGTVEDNYVLNGVSFTFDEVYNASTKTMKDIYPELIESNDDIDMSISKTYVTDIKYSNPKKEVKVFVPVFPGTNCDYDTAKAFNEAGAQSEIFVFRNTMENDVIESINEMAKKIDASDILVISGGFSAGDEPDGSGKFIANILNNEKVKNAIERLIARKGLILGICNGFQALVKSGLLPDGKLGSLTPTSPTLVKNNINRHISKIVTTRVSTNKSPWLQSFNVGDTHSVAVSHGEGKFVVSKEDAKKLFDEGLVAFQYVDFDNNPTMDCLYNPNGSYYAIEGIISPDGLILGKMGHSERKGDNVFKNISGCKNQDIFKNAVDYFAKEN